MIFLTFPPYNESNEKTKTNDEFIQTMLVRCVQTLQPGRTAGASDHLGARPKTSQVGFNDDDAMTKVRREQRHASSSTIGTLIL